MTFKDKKGFTLTELLTVMAIIGILVAIGFPAIISQISHIRLTRSVRDMATELNGTRLKAIAQNQKYRLHVTINSAPAADTYRMQYYPAASWDDEPTRALLSLDSGINISAPGSSFDVYFFPNGASSSDGTPTPASSSICIENTSKANDKMKITVQGATGMIKVDTGC